MAHRAKIKLTDRENEEVFITAKEMKEYTPYEHRNASFNSIYIRIGNDIVLECQDNGKIVKVFPRNPEDSNSYSGREFRKLGGKTLTLTFD